MKAKAAKTVHIYYDTISRKNGVLAEQLTSKIILSHLRKLLSRNDFYPDISQVRSSRVKGAKKRVKFKFRIKCEEQREFFIFFTMNSLFNAVSIIQKSQTT